MWLVREIKLLTLVSYLITMYWIEEISCLSNRVLMASRSTSRALTIPYDIAETLAIENQVNEPYRFSYKVQDNGDNMQFRNEEKTSDGQVKGSYGYKDSNGIYRMVNYYSDASGFHAKIISNEPGVIPRRDHVKSINRDLFAKQTPLSYNPANVEWIMNSNQPDFSSVNTMASEYNGDWRYNNDLNSNSPLLAREWHAFNGGDQYAGAASQVIESRRLNGVNNLYENEKQKLSLLVVPKKSHVSNSNSPVLVSSTLSGDNFKSTNIPLSSSVHQPISQSNKQLFNQPLNQPSTQTINNLPTQSIVNQQFIQNSQQSQVQQPIRQAQKFASRQPSNHQQVVRKERRRITGVRRVAKKAKDQTYFSNSKIELLPPTLNRKEDSLQLPLQQSDNISLQEFSKKFPETWEKIFNNGVFDEDKSPQYAQLEAVAIRPDISVLADQSFMKPTQQQPLVKKEGSISKQVLAKKIDRVGVLPRKSIQYLPPLNSETLLTSATINSAEHHRSSSTPRMIPRMMNSSPTTTTTPQPTRMELQSIQTVTTPILTTKQSATIQSLTPTTLASIINPSSSELTINKISNSTNSSSPTTEEQLTTTMSSTTIEVTKNESKEKLNEKMEEESKKDLKVSKEKLETEKVKSAQQINDNVTTESPLTTSTSVSIVTSTSIDQSKKDSLKFTMSPINNFSSKKK